MTNNSKMRLRADLLSKIEGLESISDPMLPMGIEGIVESVIKRARSFGVSVPLDRLQAAARHANQYSLDVFLERLETETFSGCSAALAHKVKSLRAQAKTVGNGKISAEYAEKIDQVSTNVALCDFRRNGAPRDPSHKLVEHCVA